MNDATDPGAGGCQNSVTRTERSYHAERNAGTDHPADRGAPFVYVRDAGRIRPLRQVATLGASGFEWGYAGAGPGALALSLLADVLGLDDRAAMEGEPYHAHAAFKRQVVSKLPHEGWSMSREAIVNWLKAWRDGGDLPPDACEVCGASPATVRGGDMAWCDRCWKTMGDPARFDDDPSTTASDQT